MVLYRLETKRVSLHAVLTLLHGEDVSHELSGRVLWAFVYKSPVWLRIGSVAYSWVAINNIISCTEGSYIKFISFSHF